MRLDKLRWISGLVNLLKPSLPTTEILVERAIKLEPNSIYAIEVDRPLRAAERDALRDQLRFIYEQHGVRFVVLEAGMKIAKETVTD